MMISAPVTHIMVRLPTGMVFNSKITFTNHFIQNMSQGKLNS